MSTSPLSGISKAHRLPRPANLGCFTGTCCQEARTACGGLLASGWPHAWSPSLPSGEKMSLRCPWALRGEIPVPSARARGARESRAGRARASPRLARRAPELQFYTSAAALAMLIPAWVLFMVGPPSGLHPQFGGHDASQGGRKPQPQARIQQGPAGQARCQGGPEMFAGRFLFYLLF